MSDYTKIGCYWLFDAKGQYSIWKTVPKPALEDLVNTNEFATDDIYVQIIIELEPGEHAAAVPGGIYSYNSSAFTEDHWTLIEEEDIPLALLGGLG